MRYDKKIKYVDYYENGERVKGGGFIKLEIRDNALKMDLNIRGLYPTDSFVRDVIIKGPETEAVLGQITLQEGVGCFHYSCEMEPGIGSTGISYEELQEIRISVGGSRELCCALGEDYDNNVTSARLQETESLEEESQESENIAEEEAIEASEEPRPPEAELQETEIQEESQKAEVCEEEPQEAEVREEKLQETEVCEEEPQETEVPKTQAPPEQKPAVKLLENKWQQLSSIYPHIKPFQDNRDYLSLSPSDFVLFPESYYRAANNSFMLHGFYNYNHLILARVERRSEVRYYLGVPGNYYEREKQVAVMFGFESFECEREPAKTGDFGYYLMRMEL